MYKPDNVHEEKICNPPPTQKKPKHIQESHLLINISSMLSLAATEMRIGVDFKDYYGRIAYLLGFNPFRISAIR